MLGVNRMRVCRALIVGWLGFGALSSCRPVDPPPTQYEDLGTEDRPLLPTGSAWHDPAIAKGAAEWHAFRKLDPNAAAPKPAAGDHADGASVGLEGELRELLKEFNDALAADKLDDALEFLIEEQIEPTKKVIEILPKFAEKLGEFAAVLPGENESLKKLPTALAPATVLKLDVRAIQAKGEAEAVGPMAGADPPVEVRFVLIKEKDGGAVWYIDHPQIRAMSAALPAMEQSLTQLDAMIAGIKSGQIAGDALTQQAAALDQMIKAMMPAEKPAENDEK